jgi:hypothetical protein
LENLRIYLNRYISDEKIKNKIENKKEILPENKGENLIKI